METDKPYEPYIGEIIMEYQVVAFIRYHHGILMFKVEHVKSKFPYLLKMIDVSASTPNKVTMFINEIRILSSIDHPLFFEYVESFVELDKQLICAIYQYERSININEIMFRLSYNGQHTDHSNMINYLVHAAFIGRELDKRRVEMLEMDPKNLYQNQNTEFKLGSCLKFFIPNMKVKDVGTISSDNVTAPELITKNSYGIMTNVWHFGYVGYLMSSLKFNFQRAKSTEMKKLSEFFYKVLEKSKIRVLFKGAIFDTIWVMMQPAPELRASWSEILQTADFREAVEAVEAKYPGLLKRTLEKEKLPLKPLINLEGDLLSIHEQLISVYGQKLDSKGWPVKPKYQ